MTDLVFFDLETTGTDPEKDRIVEIAMISRERESLVTLVNPEIEIPLSATEVHGISNEDVEDAPYFASLTRRIRELIDGAVLVGYNSRSFDTMLLDAELQRCERVGLPRDEDGVISVREIDLLQVWKNVEPRNLTTAARRFAGVDLTEDAHRAEADTAVLEQVLHGMIEQLPDVKFTDLEDLSRHPGEVDRDGKFRRRDDGVIELAFGKNRGRPAVDHPAYLRWMIRKDFSGDTKAWAERILAAMK